MIHAFDTEHAKLHGLPAAVIIANFQWWINRNRANGENYKEGRTWTYNSIKALCEIFDYLTADQIRRALDRLVERDVLIKGFFNDKASDRTSWYAFKDESIWLGCQNHLAKTTNGIGRNAKSTNTTDSKQDGKQDSARATRLPADWMPSEDDLSFCQQERPDLSPQDTASRFRDYWIAQPTSRAKKTNWSATWRNWVRNERSGSRMPVNQQPQAAANSHLGPAGQATAAAAANLIARIQRGEQ